MSRRTYALGALFAVATFAAPVWAELTFTETGLPDDSGWVDPTTGGPTVWSPGDKALTRDTAFTGVTGGSSSTITATGCNLSLAGSGRGEQIRWDGTIAADTIYLKQGRFSPANNASLGFLGSAKVYIKGQFFADAWDSGATATGISLSNEFYLAPSTYTEGDFSNVSIRVHEGDLTLTGKVTLLPASSTEKGTVKVRTNNDSRTLTLSQLDLTKVAVGGNTTACLTVEGNLKVFFANEAKLNLPASVANNGWVKVLTAEKVDIPSFNALTILLNGKAVDSNLYTVTKNAETGSVMVETAREPVSFERTLSTANEYWTVGAEEALWRSAGVNRVGVNPSEIDSGTLAVETPSELTLSGETRVTSLTLNDPAALTFKPTTSGETTTGSLEVFSSTAVNTDTDVSDITASLGAVTLAPGKTLTMNGLAFSAMTNNGGALCFKGGTANSTLLQTFNGKMTLRNGANVKLPDQYTMPSAQRFIADSGTATLTLYNNRNGSDDKVDTDGDETIQVKNGAQLTLKARDLGGWDGYRGDYLAVAVRGTGSKITAGTYDTNPGCFVGRVVLADGGEIAGGDTASAALDFYGTTSTDSTKPDYPEIYVSSGTGTWSGYLWRKKGLVVEVADGATFVLSGILKGSAGATLKKIGAGKMKFTTAQTEYTGALTIAGGQVTVSDAGTLGTGTVTVNEGKALEVQVADSAIKTIANTISGAGTVKKSGAGTLSLTGAVSTPVEVAEGTLDLGTQRLTLGGVADGAKVKLTATEAELANCVVTIPTTMTTAPAKERFTVLKPDGTELTLTAEPTIDGSTLTVTLPRMGGLITTNGNWSEAGVSTETVVYVRGGESAESAITVTLDADLSTYTQIAVFGHVKFVTTTTQETLPTTIALESGSVLTATASFSEDYIIPSGATVVLDGTTAITSDSALTVNGALTTKGTVTLTNAGCDFSGPLTVESGTTTWRHNGANKSISGAVTVKEGATFATVADYKYALTLSGALSGAGTVRVKVPTASGQHDGARFLNLEGACAGFTGTVELEITVTGEDSSGETMPRRTSVVIKPSDNVFNGAIDVVKVAGSSPFADTDTEVAAGLWPYSKIFFANNCTFAGTIGGQGTVYIGRTGDRDNTKLLAANGAPSTTAGAVTLKGTLGDVVTTNGDTTATFAGQIFVAGADRTTENVACPAASVAFTTTTKQVFSGALTGAGWKTFGVEGSAGTFEVSGTFGEAVAGDPHEYAVKHTGGITIAPGSSLTMAMTASTKFAGSLSSDGKSGAALVIASGTSVALSAANGNYSGTITVEEKATLSNAGNDQAIPFGKGSMTNNGTVKLMGSNGILPPIFGSGDITFCTNSVTSIAAAITTTGTVTFESANGEGAAAAAVTFVSSGDFSGKVASISRANIVVGAGVTLAKDEASAPLITIAAGKSLSGGGTIKVPVTFTETAKILIGTKDVYPTILGTITLPETNKIRVDLPSATRFLAAANDSGLTLENFALVNETPALTDHHLSSTDPSSDRVIFSLVKQTALPSGVKTEEFDDAVTAALAQWESYGVRVSEITQISPATSSGVVVEDGSRSIDAAALFTNVLSIVPVSTDFETTAKAKVAYDFGVSAMTVKSARLGNDTEAQLYVVLCAKVSNGTASGDGAAAYGTKTTVSLLLGDKVCDGTEGNGPAATELIDDQLTAMKLTRGAGEKWFAVPMSTLGTGTHAFTVEASKTAPAN